MAEDASITAVTVAATLDADIADLALHVGVTAKSYTIARDLVTKTITVTIVPV